MMRVYIAPVTGSGVKGDPYATPARAYGYEYSNFIPSGPDGRPLFTWALVAVRSNDFSAIAADTRCDDLFAGDLPPSIDTGDEMRALLRSRTVSDVPVARRNAIIAVLDKYGIAHSDFTGQTSLWRVFQRVTSTLYGSLASEADLNFPAF